MSTFTIPFPEYDIANYLQERFPKKLNFSVNIPLSRQQKYYDLVLMNGVNKKVVIIQVKSSRTWKGNQAEFDSFFNRFDIEDNYSDYYFMYMTYPILSKNFSPSAKWGRKILVFSHKEMLNIFNNIQTKGGNKENRFSFGFNSDNDLVIGGRGFQSFKSNNFTGNLIESKLKEIEKALSNKH